MSIVLIALVAALVVIFGRMVYTFLSLKKETKLRKLFLQ